MARVGEVLEGGCRRADRVRSWSGGGGGSGSVRFVVDDVLVAVPLRPRSLCYPTRANLHLHLRRMLL